MKYLCAVVTTVLALFLGMASKRVVGHPISCSYDNPEHRKLCMALVSLYSQPNPTRPLKQFEHLPLEYKGRIVEFVKNNLPGTKREDIEHIFLRFGR